MPLKITTFQKKKKPSSPSKITLPKRGEQLTIETALKEPKIPPNEPKPKKEAPTDKTEEKQSEKPSGLIPFKPGQSGNPAGRPKGKDPYLAALKISAAKTGGFIMDPETGEKSAVLNHQIIMDKLVEKAKNGDMKAIELYMDRLMGKVKPAKEDGDDEVVQRIIILPARSTHPPTNYPAMDATVIHDQKPKTHEQ